MKKTIGIDARMYGLKNAGIGRYVENLIEEISKINFHNYRIQFTLFLRKNDLSQLKNKYGKKFKYIEADFPHYSLKEQLAFPSVLLRAKCDLIHFPHFNVPLGYRQLFVVTIHDLTKHFSRGKETTTRSAILYCIKYWGYKIIFNNTIKRAKLIFVDSNYTRQILTKQYQIKPKKIKVTYLGVENRLIVKSQNLKVKSKENKNKEIVKSQNLKVKEKILQKYHITKPYLLYVGSVYPHKNIERLIKAVKKSRKTIANLSLVIVCARNIFEKRLKNKIKAMNAQTYVKLTGFVSDEDLAILYQQSKAFAFPSLSEGFGLPGLEAMACGCPVISSNTTCLPEIYGNAALYFDPLKTTDITQKIVKLIKDNKLRKDLIKKGYQRVKKYSWEKMAAQTVNGYRKAIEINK